MVARPPISGHGVFDSDDCRGWYTYGVNLADWMLPCRLCATDKRKRWLEEHSGLESAECQNRADAFKLIRSEDNPGMLPQRRIAKTLIERAIASKAGLFTFWGDFGSGKTLALQVIINELRVQNLLDGYYASFAAVIDHLRTLFATKQDASAYWDRMLSVPVLALDEVTRFDDQKGWVKDRLFLLADTRYRMRKSHLTVFATNSNPNSALPPDDAIGYLFSRMREGQLCELRGDVRSVVRQ